MNEDGWRQGLADFVWFGRPREDFYENPPSDWIDSYRAAFKKMAEEMNGAGIGAENPNA